MKFFYVVLLILFNCFVALGNNSSICYLVQLKDFNKSFEGTINKTYAIKMALTKKGSQLTGNYYYKNNGKPLKLKGTIDNSGKINLKEFDAKGNMTGIFDGQLKANKINGYWRKPDGSKKMPFSVSEIINQKQKNSISGNYVGEAYQDINDDLSGQFLTIEQDEPDLFSFKLDVDKYGNCSGFISGMAILNKGVWKYDEGGECTIIFRFSNKQVDVTESLGCLGDHGMSCGFGGTYHKK